MLPNWNALLPYKTKKDKSFEQLCYQVAYKLNHELGVLTSIDDSGGGDGVEFYLKLDDGKEWGWQAKYYEDIPVRLTASRKTKIKESLKKTLKVHPELDRWYLCLPMVLTPGERSWAEGELKLIIPPERQLELIIWDEDTLHEFINRPAFNGLKQAFFNVLELSTTWFKTRFDVLSIIVEQKFDEDLYTENREFFYCYVDPILVNTDYITKRIAYYPRKLQELYEEGLVNLKKLEYTNELMRPLFNYGLQEFSKVNKLYLDLRPTLQERLNQLTANRVFETSEEDYSREIEMITKLIRGFSDYQREWYQTNILSKGEKEEEDFKERSKVFYPLERTYNELLEELKYYVSHSSLPLKWRVSHYQGNAGDGKTNFCIAVARTCLSQELPVIFIPAIMFTGDQTLQEQILRLLDIHVNYTFTDFLDTLNALGIIYNIRVPFILDGLNEAIDSRGHLNQRLHLDLPGLEREILKYKNIVLLTTCRPAYQEEIWGKISHDDKRFHSLYGFTNIDDKKRMIRRYFEVYKIQADLSFISLEKFTKPLYLKIFCEASNPGRTHIVSLTLGYDSIYTIFDQFLERCNDNIYKRLSRSGKYPPLSKYKRLASDMLKKIAEQMWLRPARGFDMEAMLSLADDGKLLDYEHTITKALFDEELLLIRNWDNGKEKVYLTYDMMGGYFIAQYLIEQDLIDEAYFQSHTDSRIFGGDHEQLHPLYEDILAALVSLLPIRKSLFVHDFLGLPPHKGEKADLYGRSIATTLMLSPNYIPEQQIALISKLAANEKNLGILISEAEDVFFVSDHPFNFSFWSTRLFDLPMNLRDVYWSEYIRNLSEDRLEDLVLEFSALQHLNTHTVEQLKKMDLAATYLLWTLTSTDVRVKQTSSSALYDYAIGYPHLFFEKYKYASAINDPTVLEWMSAAFYNALITLTKADIKDISSLISQIYDFVSSQILTVGGAHSTNHLTTRNYNFSLLRLLEKRCANSISKSKSSDLKAGFNSLGINQWEEASDINYEEYSDGNSLIDYYFNKNKMPQVMVGKGDEYNPTAEYKQTQAKLRWRAYQLGYNFELFSEIDKKLARYHRFGEDVQQIYRYADKYIEIAHREYCGYLDGLGKFRNYEDMGYLRTFKVKHDPSAPLEIPVSAERLRYVKTRYIDSNIPLAQWCSDDSVPDINEFLFCKELGERQGDFVLLNGEISEIDKTTERQFFVLMDVVFIKKCDLLKARKAFLHRTAIGRGPEEKPTTLNVHQSEIPDADIIPQNEFTEWTYSLEDELVDIDYTTTAMYKNGKKLSDKKADKIWESVLRGHHYLLTPRTNMSGLLLPLIQFSSNGTDDDYIKTLTGMGITLKSEQYTVNEPRPVNLELDVFVPVRYIEGEYYVCKNVIDHAGLRTKPGSTDLYDPTGNLASFSHHAKIKYRDGENFTYLDQEILNSYLRKYELSMFWLIWGERDYFPADDDWDRKPKGLDRRTWTKFYKSVEYTPVKQ